MPVNRTLDLGPSPARHAVPTRPARPRRRAVRSRFTALSGIALASLAAGVAMPAGAEAAATAKPRVTPTCDAMPGLTESLSGQWRVFWKGMPWGDEPEDDGAAELMACRRGPGPAATVVRLGRHLSQFSSCSCLSAAQPQGDLVVITRVESDKIDRFTTRRVVDLATGRSQGLDNGDRLLPGGAFLRVKVPASPSPWVVPTTPPEPKAPEPPTIAIEDGRGTTVVGQFPLTDLTPIDHVGPAYAQRPDGTVLRFDGQGAAPPPTYADPDLAPRRNVLKTRAGAARVGLLAADGRLTLTETTIRKAGRTRRSLVWNEGARRLRPGGGPVRVLATADFLAVVEAPFLGRPGRTLALVGSGADPAIGRKVASLPAGLPDGSIAVSGSGPVAVAQGDVVRVLGARTTKFSLAGAHELQLQTLDASDGTQHDRLYATDGDGTPRRLLTPPRKR